MPLTPEEEKRLSLIRQRHLDWPCSDKDERCFLLRIATSQSADLLSAQALIETCEAALKAVDECSECLAYEGTIEETLAAIEAHKKGEGA